ncbi:MAG: hypothetical protein HY720_08020 [Planctomycetes bacterium]|nr:hypothetical protein [Planctomycetota bacterium]
MVEKGRYGRAIESLESLRELLATTAGTGGEWAAIDGRAAELRDLALRLREVRGDAPAPDEPESARERVARLIAELGSTEWAERERAERVLLEEGKGAPDLLEAAQEDPDLEIRERAARVLSKIRAPGSSRPFHFLLGKILWVAGGKAYVDLGAAAGLAPGTTGVTYRPDEFGARVRVGDIRADWAMIEIVEAIRDGEARPGDLAEFSTEFGK